MSLENANELAQLAHDRLADDLLRGAPAIAEFIGTSEAAVYHLYRKKRLPIGKLGKILIAFRSELRRAAEALITTS
jgi:hypothetical protein